ncbi:MAG: hypothetical protein NTW25_01145 [Candidatus Kapabacteria bacterium]|nr:hypothetical protein [Candidatus Kapabacteria bacterium]
MNKLEGWALDLAKLMKTSDGGKTWKEDKLFVQSYNNKMIFINQNTGFIISKNLYKTTNKGNTWIDIFQISLPNTNYINSNDIYSGTVIDENNIVVLTQNYICKTTNSGLTWDSLSYVNTDFKSQFLDINSGYNNYLGSLNKTTNSGTSWTNLTNFKLKYISDFYFFNKKIAWAFGGVENSNFEKIIYTSDAGLNWSIQKSIPTISLHKMFFLNEKTGWIGSLNGIIYHTTTAGIE